MTVQMPIRATRRSHDMCEVSILHLIEWAFQREKVRIEFDQGTQHRPQGALKGYGMEHILMRQAELGCRVDGGGTSEPHPDADAVADALAVLPEGHGGQRMAMRIGELARAGQVPSWHIPEKARVVPCEWRTTKHGTFAQTESAGMISYTSRGKLREVEVKYCPIIIQNHPGDAAALRREYLGWWGALLELRDTFRIYGGLTSYVVTEAMPPRTPWKDAAR
jgi:hypothetical protein